VVKIPPKKKPDVTTEVIGAEAAPEQASVAKATGTHVVYFPPAPGYKKNLTKKDYERLAENFQEDFKAIWKRTPDPWRPTRMMKNSLFST
jgi:hypothetical protein